MMMTMILFLILLLLLNFFFNQVAKIIEHKKDALVLVGTKAQDSKLALIWPSLAGSVFFCRDFERVDHCVSGCRITFCC